MSTYNIPFYYEKGKQPKSSLISSCGIFSKGPKNEFETAVVNEPPVFEPLKFYCINPAVLCGLFLSYNFDETISI